MTTGTQSQTQIELTPQEAEAVLELWARRQAEGELRSRLNVQDLAEATGLTQAEIEKLVATVRNTKKSPPAQVPAKKVKPVNSLLIAVAVVFWLAVLAGVAMFAYGQGRASRQPFIGVNPPAIVDTALPAPPAGIAVATDMGAAVAPQANHPYSNQMPRGMRLQAEGQIIEGSSQSFIPALIKDAISQFVESVAPNQSTEVIELDAKQIELMLQPNGPAGNNAVQFVKLTGAGPNGKPFEAMLPFPLRRNAMLESAAEVARKKAIDEIVRGSAP